MIRVYSAACVQGRASTQTHTSHAAQVGAGSILSSLTAAAGACKSQVPTTSGLRQAPFGASGLVFFIPDVSRHAPRAV